MHANGDGNIKILFFGDLVGAPGRSTLQRHLPSLKEKFKPHYVIVNGENCADDGRGITPKHMQFFKRIGVDLVTSGNHIFAKKDIYPYLASAKDLIRPANFPGGCPGVGVAVIAGGPAPLGVVNLQGRVFMREHLDCPFRALESILLYLKTRTSSIIVDFHAETTSEKVSFAHAFDGRVSAVFGTHTHVQTADDRILPGGTAFITDLGMGGALYSSLGMKKDVIIHTLTTQMPMKFEVETTGPMILCGVVIVIDSKTGKAVSLERFQVRDEALDRAGYPGE